ncbi:heme NO-binding domain-containing protein [Novosphingobium sp.]|uniref:heme NO-binding domain-containing protein n=1 Tax=Novosphingobium sp. TaxID=1874826 RepID=UPI001DB80383|nr:heme NO-binding domain-containing protein [Novosphingobium sp.]MBX9665647.1 heme NO-binding domain-containing protein [Novosphingobium sp.]
MKGVIFSELIRWVEESYSPSVADQMIRQAQLPGNGSYTSVGTYPHVQALAMIGQLVEITGEPVNALAEAYGYWLSARFAELYPQFFVGFDDAITFLKAIDGIHQKEVTKLYPDALTPSVIAEVDGQDLLVSYASHRPFAEVAHGLIRGYIGHFGDDLVILRDETTPGPHAARFILQRK